MHNWFILNEFFYDRKFGKGFLMDNLLREYYSILGFAYKDTNPSNFTQFGVIKFLSVMSPKETCFA